MRTTDIGWHRRTGFAVVALLVATLGLSLAAPAHAQSFSTTDLAGTWAFVQLATPAGAFGNTSIRSYSGTVTFDVDGESAAFRSALWRYVSACLIDGFAPAACFLIRTRICFIMDASTLTALASSGSPPATATTRSSFRPISNLSWTLIHASTSRR